jgi:hypothetical protein
MFKIMRVMEMFVLGEKNMVLPIKGSIAMGAKHLKTT